MVLPVTGPVIENRSNNLTGAGSYRVYRERYKQKMPVDRDLPFYSQHVRVLSADGIALSNGQYVEYQGNANANHGYSPWQTFCYTADYNTPEVVKAVQLARERFVSEISSQAQVLVNLAEAAEVKHMLVDRVVRLAKAYRSFTGGDFYRARSVLRAKKRHTPNPDPRKFLRKPGECWLEWHFGWSPLLGDIHRSLDVLAGDVPKLTAIGRGANSLNWRFDSGYFRVLHTAVAKATVRAQISVENKNRWMKNQLGLLNPAAIAWELVPFSFLVDWFVNIDSLLAQFNEFEGLKIDRPLTSYKFVNTARVHCEEWYHPTNTLVRSWSTVSQAVTSERILGIPTVRPRFNMPKRLSWQRGLTAASLLTGMLKSTPK